MFIEERLLDCVSYGTIYGERFRTDIATMRNKSESRNMEWSESRGEFTLVFAALTEPDRAEVMRVFRVCRGRGIGFRMKNWVDYKASDEALGVGAGEDQSYQMTITANSGSYKTTKTIRKPVMGTIQVKADGVPVAANIDYRAGIITTNAPIGAVLTWSGEYDIPVRFDSDDIQWSVDNRSGDTYVMGSDVQIVELAE